ncbi:MAG: DUF4390 domain-containing protein [Deltaproteobacteria bacterium]|nr:DUF4390 domain-containing protein [Deltaproteobacteria bacterium]
MSILHHTCKSGFMAAAVLLLLLCCCPPVALALQHFTGEAPELSVQEGGLGLSLRLSVDDEDELRLLLRNGASLELVINAEILRQRTFLPNESLDERNFSFLLKYDSLTRQYRMSDPLTGKILQDPNMRSLLTKTWKQLELPLTNMDIFAQDEDYLVLLKLTLQYAEIPPWLDRSLVFWSREVVEPETYKLEFNLDDAAFSR